MKGAPALRPAAETFVGCAVELTNIALPPTGGQSLARQTELLREKLGSALGIVDQLSGAPVARSVDQQVSEREIRMLIRLRRNRDRFFAADLFADPAWDILLELYAAQLGQLRISVSNLCAAAAVPATTALRWITQLEEKGLIARRSDPTDGRRQFLMLSSEGFDAMNGYFRTVPTGATLV
jgi:DNA-binding MarR family transcriptional regulator